jgi:hypothetical protein
VVSDKNILKYIHIGSYVKFFPELVLIFDFRYAQKIKIL